MRCDSCANCFTSAFDGMRMCSELDCVKGSKYVSKNEKKIKPVRMDQSVRETENFWRNK